MRLILYSKPDCHLCEGLQEKIEQIRDLKFELEVRDITTQAEWFAAYQYEIPVLCRVIDPDPDSENQAKEEPLPRPSPRASVQQVQQMLQQYFPKNDSQ
ncbi:glutaredoxin family protein [Oscillatoria acuminata]|uniref:Glutaredoxin-like domain (DUF836) n=1 Tax=Oscillatoria acuminata PCC 6304 TaxID=56110 RepID=K9TLH9_9CYAN|nr:glutaredoxin family protein [Oscillatoria acuminata]AFY83258.1 Glutaredoxin-like domain (DUF836) [Oscillatoria acuminata PCC 6304]